MLSRATFALFLLLSGTVFDAHAQDRQGPTIPNVPTINPNVVDVSNGNETVTVTLDAEDATGVMTIIGFFRDAETQVVFGNFSPTRVSGTAQNGRYSGEATITRGVPAGVYTLDMLLTDTANNLSQAAFEGVLTVSGGDTTRPRLTGTPTLSPDSVVLSQDPVSVVASADIEDADSGVGQVVMLLKSINGTPVAVGQATLVEGDANSGTWQNEFVIDPSLVNLFAPAGDLFLGLQIVDNASNVTLLDSLATVRVIREKAAVTFQVDMRRLERLGLFQRTDFFSPGMRLFVDVQEGDDAGSYELFDVDSDSIWSARVEVTPGDGVLYRFAIDPDGDGTNLGDWVYERPGDPRSVDISTGTTLPAVPFDDQPSGVDDVGFSARSVNAFRSGTSGLVPYDGNEPNVLVSLDGVETASPVLIGIRRRAADPGGSAPSGMATISSAQYWIVDQVPSGLPVSGSFVVNFDPVSGITDASALRLLRRGMPSDAWAVTPTTTSNAETTVTSSTQPLSGQWTLGSTSSANLLTPLFPEMPADPVPVDGDQNVAITQDLLWSDTPLALQYDVYLWEEGSPEPDVPAQRDLVTPRAAANALRLKPDASYLWFVVAKNLDGETRGPTWSFATELPSDLVLSDVEVPDGGFSGGEIGLRWTVTNGGSIATNSPSWYDRISLSDDPSFLENVRLLGSFENPSALAPGEQYVQEAVVTLPDDVSGPYFLKLVVNGGGGQDEVSFDNNSALIPLQITASPAPDLRISQITAPLNAFSGGGVQIAWTVENTGEGLAASDIGWVDNVFLSSTPEFAFETSEFLGSLRRLEPLASGASYDAVLATAIPDQISGNWYFLVYSDRIGSVFERERKANNLLASEPIAVTLSPPPDLAVVSLRGPDAYTAGDSVPLAWNIQNQGPAELESGSWQDRVLLEGPGLDEPVPLTNVPRAGSIAPDSSYTVATSVILPDGLEGSYQLVLETDWNDTVFEHTFEVNNRRTLDIEIVRPPYPDLVLTAVTMPSSVRAGEEIRASWTVQNEGESTVETTWNDRVYLSTTAQFDSTALPVEAVAVDQTLDPGMAYTRVAAIRIPTDFRAQAYVFVVTDADEGVFEFAGETETDAEANNLRAVALDVAPYPPVDLAVVDVQAPTEAATGEAFTISWAVENQGEAETPVPVWEDLVYLSADSRIDANADPLLARVPRAEGLPAGETYRREVDVMLPDGAAGPFQILVYNVVTDADSSNNVAASADPLTARVGPTPDLTLTSVDMPTTGVGGQPLEMTWTVRNEGDAETGGTWNDVVFLSVDRTIGFGDVPLVLERRSDPLAPGSEYTQTVQSTVPFYASGPRFLLLSLDNGEGVYEASGEANNQTVYPIEILLQPPADLIVTDVAVPANAVPGEEISVSWTVRNEGPNPATGFLRDALYVSDDDVWQVSDPLLGNQGRSINLAPGTSMRVTGKVDLSKVYQADDEGNITGDLPGVAPGSYHIIVRVDVQNNIRETIETNNAGASAERMLTDMPELVLGGSVAGSLVPGQSAYYRVVVPATVETFTLDLESSADNASNELHVRAGEVPTRGSSDVAFRDPNRASFTVVVPQQADDDSTYYVLVHARQGPSSGQDYTLRAMEALFDLQEIDLAEGGQDGDVTVRMTGTAFGKRLEAVLEREGVRVTASRIVRAHSAEAYATFDLSGVALGAYDVVLEKNVSQVVIEGDSLRIEEDIMRSVLPERFQVVPPLAAAPSFDIGLPEAVRVDQEFVASIEVTNRGNTDLVSPLVVFWTSPATLVTPHLDEAETTGYQRLLLTGPGPVAGVLRPGATHRALLKVVSPPRQSALRIYAGAIVGSGAPFSLANELQAAFLDGNGQSWLDAAEQLERELAGAGWPAYEQRLAETASRLSERGSVEQDATRLLLHLLRDIQSDQIIPPFEPSGASDPGASLAKTAEIQNPCDWIGDVPAEYTCSTTQLIADEATLACVAAGIATPQICGGTHGAKHLLHFLTGDGSPIVYGNDSDVAAKLKSHDDGFVSYEDVQQETLQSVRQQIENQIRAAGCTNIGSVDPAGDLGDLGVMVRNPNPYLTEVSKGIPYYDPFSGGLPDQIVYEQAGCDLITAFGGFQMSTGRLSGFQSQVFPDPIAYCIPGCTVVWEADVTYEFSDLYEFDDDDAGGAYDRRGRHLQLCGDAKPFETKVIIEDRLGGIVKIPPELEKCPRLPIPELPPFLFLPPEILPVLNSVDPNDIVGPAGYGDERWVSVSARLPYKIRFENDPERATAPAQIVSIEQQLPDSTVDVRSFRLGPFGFGELTFSPPENTAFYSERLDLSDSLGIFVDVNAGLDVETNRAFWVLRTIDPATGGVPVNPLAGFLPVNDSTGVGEGYVAYTIRPNPSARTGDVIRARADIVFDNNDVIETPEVTNTIDADLPTSQVHDTAFRADSTVFEVRWRGRDANPGSGFKAVDLYVSKDDGPYEVYRKNLDGSSVEFGGDMDHTYRFYTLSADNAGNLEPAKTDFDTIVIVGTEETEELPEEYALGPNYPNPFNPATVVPYALPRQAEVELLIYNALGQRVVNYRIGDQRAGRHEQRVDLGRLASGVYFYEIQAREAGRLAFREVRKFVLVK